MAQWPTVAGSRDVTDHARPGDGAGLITSGGACMVPQDQPRYCDKEGAVASSMGVSDHTTPGGGAGSTTPDGGTTAMRSTWHRRQRSDSGPTSPSRTTAGSGSVSALRCARASTTGRPASVTPTPRQEATGTGHGWPIARPMCSLTAQCQTGSKWTTSAGTRSVCDRTTSKPSPTPRTFGGASCRFSDLTRWRASGATPTHQRTLAEMVEGTDGAARATATARRDLAMSLDLSATGGIIG